MQMRQWMVIAILAAAIAEPAGAQTSPPRLTIWGVTNGVRVARSGRWCTLVANVTNPTDQAVAPLAAVSLGTDQNLQYGRRLWTPPNSRRHASQLVQIPDSGDATQLSVYNRFFLDPDREVNQRSEPGQRVDSTLVSLNRELSVTSFVADGRNEDPAADMIQSGRTASYLDRSLAIMYDDYVPDTPEAWDAADQVVIADNRVTDDSAALIALRAWVLRGGNLALILERVTTETVESLLLDDWTGQIVDRVGLTTFEMTRPQDGRKFEPFELEEPVELARVLPGDSTVLLTVNGWPAVIRKNLGRGSVTLFAIGPRAMVRKRGPGDPQVPSLEQTPWVARDAWADLAPMFFTSRPAPLTPVAAMAHATSEQIGYRIPERGMIAGVLGGICGLLLVAGVVWQRRQTLEQMAWFAPLVSVVTGTLLAGVAYSQRSATPPMAVSSQYASVSANQRPIGVEGVLSLYSPEGGPVRLGSRGGGVFLPSSKSLADRTRRMVWDDFDSWEWENISLPAGITPIPFRTTANGPMIRAEGRFGPEGFQGTLRGAPLEDLVLMTESTRAIAAATGADGSFVARREDVQAPGTFVSGTLLTDEQRRRQSVLKQFHSEYRKTLPTELLLVGWREALDLGWILPEGVSQTGSTFCSVPVQLMPTAPGTTIVVPSAFLPFRPVPGPRGEGQSSPYSYRSGEWQERSGPAKSWLRVQFPASVLPLNLTRVNVVIQIVGPAGRIAIQGLENGTPREIAVAEEPVGTIRFQLERPEDVKLDASGGLTFGIKVGRDGDVVVGEARGLKVWKIESVEVDAEGVVQPRSLE